MVSHPSRVRGLKSTFRTHKAVMGLSHPSRVRGLKFSDGQPLLCQYVSHPSRVRGLKSLYGNAVSLAEIVAPLAGAWIEITSDTNINNSIVCRTPRGCVD